MRRGIGIAAFLVVVLVSVLVVLKKSAPAGPSAPAAKEPPSRAIIRLPERASEKNPLTTGRVTRARLAADLQVVGSVTYDRDHYAVVGPLVSGRMVKVLASLGDPVKAGQVLAIVESADIGQAQADFLSARARAQAADSHLARQKELAELKIASVREHEVAQAQAASEKAGTRAAVERLRAYGLGAGDLERLEAGESSGGRVPLRTPIAGTVVARNVSLGQAVEPATDAFAVANLSKLWVLLDLYEKDLRHVFVDQSVELRTEAAPGEVFKARVAYVTPLVDEKTRTASVRLEIDHNDNRLRPGQFVTAKLLADSQHGAPESLAVPRKAVQSIEGKSLVFRKKQDGFEPVFIEVGVASADLVEVRSGLEENDEVVVDGAFLLKSEYSR